MTPMKSGIAALFVALVVLGTPALARADGYAVVSIENPTRNTVHYSYRWGDGPWQKACLAPGQYMLHSWQYEPGTRSSPAFHISFDWSLTDGVVESKGYSLQRYAARYRDRYHAKRYAFRVSACGHYLDLYSIS